MKNTRVWPLGVGMLMAVCCTTAMAQTGAATEAPRIDTAKISNGQMTALKGTVPLRTLKSTDSGPMNTTAAIPSMTLLLKRSDAQQKRFDDYVSSLSNPSSPNFHKWLTAAQIGQQFGPRDEDITAVKSWLKSQGLAVKAVAPTKMSIKFSGSVGAVQRAFHTQMHTFVSEGKTHFSNASEQQLPSALTPVVSGVVSLSNFFPQSMVRNVQTVKKDGKGRWVKSGASSDFNFALDGDIYYDVVPQDLNTIYNVTPLWNESTPIRGAGQSIAVLERTDVQDADVATFRTAFMPSDAAGVFTQVHPALYSGDTSCADPGTNSDEGEAALDAEWAGAAAPDANVVLASCADTGSDFGPFLAAQNLLFGDAPPPAVFSLSYGECELVSAAIGDADFANDLWQTAAAEGVSVFVSSGDAGSAGCDQNEAAASFGLSVNGLGGTSYNTSVGGTDFADLNNESKYWAPGNGNLGASALSYIPEQTWNSSCASSVLYGLLNFTDPNTSCNSASGQRFLDTADGSGGPSSLWIQPDWQMGVAGLPQMFTRSLPDVSLFSSSGIYGHALIFCMSDEDEQGTPCNYLDPTSSYYNSAGGTSFAAPTMAGIQALINQKAGVSHGNITPTLYDLARKQYGSVGSPTGRTCSATSTDPLCVFHDVTVGDIAVPCYAGTEDCYSKGADNYGVVSDGGRSTLVTAWKAGAGYDYATGLGSLNVANLVSAVASQDAHANTSPSWSIMGLDQTGNLPENSYTGRSNVVLLNQSTGASIFLAMNGGTVVATNTTTGLTLSPGDQLKSVITDNGYFTLAGAPILEIDNATTHTASAAVYAGAWAALPIGVYPAGWTLLGAGIVDNSGTSSEVWFNATTGQFGYWKVGCSALYVLGRPRPSCGRDIGATFDVAAGYTPRLADLNGDGFTDIVWTGPNNDIYYWINDGQGNFTKTYGGTFPAGWQLVGVGAIAGSGNTDLVWFNASTSQMGWWTMNGATVVDRQVRSVAAGYSIADIGDFDGDGLADLLFSNAAGDAWVWQGTGGGFVSQHLADGQGTPYTIPAGFTIQLNRLQGIHAVVQAPPPPP